MNNHEFDKFVLNIVDQCSYKPGWVLKYENFGGGCFIQVSFRAPCTTSAGNPEVTQRSGKAYLSAHMCKQEIVGVIAGLIERAEVHEMRENFKYKGKAIFGPHIDPDALVTVADQLSTRKAL